MLKYAGILIILVCSVYYGNILSKSADSGLSITESLLYFIRYISTSIKTARLPLTDIFETFSDPILEELGFLQSVRMYGIFESAELIKDVLSKDSYEAIMYLGKNLGGIDTESQLGICSYAEEILSKDAEIIKKDLREKKKMYRLLPILAGMSVIILTM